MTRGPPHHPPPLVTRGPPHHPTSLGDTWSSPSPTALGDTCQLGWESPVHALHTALGHPPHLTSLGDTWQLGWESPVHANLMFGGVVFGKASKAPHSNTACSSRPSLLFPPIPARPPQCLPPIAPAHIATHQSSRCQATFGLRRRAELFMSYSWFEQVRSPAISAFHELLSRHLSYADGGTLTTRAAGMSRHRSWRRRSRVCSSGTPGSRAG